MAGMGFGAGLGEFIGAELGAYDLNAGINTVRDTANGFNAETRPYNTFGQSFLEPASGGIAGINDVAGTSKSYDDFMKDYTNTPAVKYQLDQMNRAQENSAAAKGGLLSGTNLRALSTIDNGIVSQGANTAYNEYLAGNSQQFGQLEAALGNMFNAIGVGTTATGQQAGVAQSQMAQQAALAQAQAKNDQSKGSGLGSMFGGLGAVAAMF